MRNLWIDLGHEPAWDRIGRAGITGVFFDIRDPAATKKYLTSIYNGGVQVGVYACPGPAWPEFPEPGAAFAEAVHQVLDDRYPSTGAVLPRVMLDIEAHSSQAVIDTLTRWRELRPTRATSWTMEPRQHGWMTPELVATVDETKVRVVPQYYLGDMTPVAQDIEFNRTRAKFPNAAISGFYDAKVLPVDWDGYAFIQHRLP